MTLGSFFLTYLQEEPKHWRSLFLHIAVIYWQWKKMVWIMAEAFLQFFYLFITSISLAIIPILILLNNPIVDLFPLFSNLEMERAPHLMGSEKNLLLLQCSHSSVKTLIHCFNHYSMETHSRFGTSIVIFSFPLFPFFSENPDSFIASTIVLWKFMIVPPQFCYLLFPSSCKKT